MSYTRKDNKGFTIIEIILALLLSGIIVVGFIPLFVASAKANSKSKISFDSTYIAKDNMEMIYNLSKTARYEEIEEVLNEKGYIKTGSNELQFGKEIENKYLVIKLNEQGNLVRIIVSMYKDDTLNKLEAKYESLYSWIYRGVLSEE